MKKIGTDGTGRHHRPLHGRPDRSSRDRVRRRHDQAAPAEWAYLNKGVWITLPTSASDRERKSFYFEGGIARSSATSTGPRGSCTPPVYVDEREGDAIEVAIQYNDGYDETISPSPTTSIPIDGGTHLTGFRTALTCVLND